MAERVTRRTGQRRPSLPRFGALAVGLGVVAAACATQQAPLVGVSSTVAPADEPLAAFVVYTRTFKTILVPKEKTDPVVVMDGLWVLGQDRIARYETLAGGALAPEGMRCSVKEPGPADHPCDLPDVGPGAHAVLVTVEPRPHRTPGAASPECTCYRDATESEDDDGGGDAGDEDEDQDCEESYSDLGPVALSGGKLYSVGIADNGGCDGPHAVSVEVDVEDPLQEAATPRVTGESRCAKDLPGEEYVSRWTGEACTDPGCCDFAPNPAPVVVASCGTVTSYDLHADDAGALRTRITTAKASPALCPGPFDPCGTGAAFPKDVQDGTFWATTDETAALVVGRGRVSVYAKNQVAPTRTEAIPEAPILGVRYHPDASPLLRRMQREATLLAPHD